MKNHTTVERKSDTEVVVTRTVDAPAELVFKAWTQPKLFRQWWVPRSMDMTLRSCDLDVRVGGGYRLVFDSDPASTMAFFGTYLEVLPPSRLVWTNEENGNAGSTTTLTLTESNDHTLMVLTERYPSREALDAAGTGAQDAMHETFNQLDELLAAISTSSN